jgi:DNA-binding GntR family transcriptional regulator
MQFTVQTTAERVAAAVRDAIMHGRIGPGTQLPEHQLREALGVSRNTIREALRMLTHEGLVRHDPYRGVSVPRLTEADVHDIFSARAVLELSAANVASSASPEQLNRLDAARQAFEKAVDDQDWAAAFGADMELHRSLVALTGSERLEQVFEALFNELRLGYFVSGGLESESLPDDRKQHRAIVAAVRKGDDARAGDLVRAHLERSEKLLLELMREHTDEVERTELGSAIAESAELGSRRG